MGVESLGIRFSGGIVGVASTPSSLSTSGKPPSRRTSGAGLRSVRNGCESRLVLEKVVEVLMGRAEKEEEILELRK